MKCNHMWEEAFVSGLNSKLNVPRKLWRNTVLQCLHSNVRIGYFILDKFEYFILDVKYVKFIVEILCLLGCYMTFTSELCAH